MAQKKLPLDWTAQREHSDDTSQTFKQAEQTLGSPLSLPTELRQRMEGHMGADFSGVRLYESEAVGRMGAQAAASGNRVAFDKGKLDLASRDGQQLLGHELSHVASQMRGQVTGHGLVQDKGLEAKADADGHAALDSLSGQTVTPLTDGPAIAPAGGAVQAKKNEKNDDEGEYRRLKEEYAGKSDHDKVKMLIDLTVISTSGQNTMTPGELRAYNEICDTAPPELMAEVLRQQVGAAGDLLSYRDELTESQSTMQNVNQYNEKGQTVPFEEAVMDYSNFKSKNSILATQYQAFNSLVFSLGLNNNAAFEQYIDLAKAMPTEDPMGQDLLRQATTGIINNTSAGYAYGDDAEQEELRQSSTAANLRFSENYERPWKKKPKKWWQFWK